MLEAVIAATVAWRAVAATAALDSAVRTAHEAWGERVGGVGVRRFERRTSGPDRMDCECLVRRIRAPAARLEGVGVRVGMKGARLDAPSRSRLVKCRIGPLVDTGLHTISFAAVVLAKPRAW